MRTRLITALLLIGVGCSGDDPAFPIVPSFVAGYVKYDSNEEAPVPHVKVYLVEYGEGELYTLVPTGRSYSTCTNARGYFSFTFEANVERDYMVGTSPSYYFGPSESVSPGTTKYVTLWINSADTWDTPTPCD